VLPTDLGEVQICDDVTDHEVKTALRPRALLVATR
jgi:hypothetical protein